ncbi:MAG: GNAT family N-acetyltransferase [Eubacteriales bacterium]
MEIRLAGINDIAGICLLYNAFFIYNTDQQPQYYKPATESGRYPKSIIENNSEDIYIAVDDNVIIGLIHIAEEQTPPFDCFIQYKFAAIIDLFIDENYRKKGIGGLLLESAKQWSKSRNLNYTELNVLAENENGIQFYNHNEFKIVSQIMRYTL